MMKSIIGSVKSLLIRDSQPDSQNDKPNDLYSLFTKIIINKEITIIKNEEWIEMINSNKLYNIHNYNKLLLSLRKGIPSNMRGNIWIYLSNAKSLALEHNIDLLPKLLNFIDDETDHLIIKDLERTILISYKDSRFQEIMSNDELKKNLFTILKAYAVYDKEVGYCQGMNFIVCILLNNIPSKRYAFWAFVNIMNHNKWRELFLPDTPKLLRMLDVLVNSIKKNIPMLYSHFEEEDFLNEFGGVFTHFFMTIFSYNVPIEYTNRVMDMFLILEERVILECLMKLLSLMKEKIIKMKHDDMFKYIRAELIRDCIKDFGIEKSLPDIVN